MPDVWHHANNAFGSGPLRDPVHPGELPLRVEFIAPCSRMPILSDSSARNCAEIGPQRTTAESEAASRGQISRVDDKILMNACPLSVI